jgi:hypothetical protein
MVRAKTEGSVSNLRWSEYFRIALSAAVALLFLGHSPAFAIVLHPDGEPNLTTWTDRPDANVVGRWSSNASFVVIAPNWIVTTRHQNTSPATVTINGVSYTCTYKTEWTGGPAGNADFRLIRLTKADGNDANLTHYAKPYEYDDEPGKDVVIGGYGDGRGADLVKNNKVYGYQWDGSANTSQRWCQNIVDGSGIDSSTYTSDVIEADFDGIGDDTWTDYEGIIADHDSGGGWFIYDGNDWKVAGLSRGVEHVEESWFRNNVSPNILDPDGFDAVRISSYAQWINQIIQSADLTADDWVDFADFALFANQWQQTDCNATNNWCAGADFIPHDGAVDLDDLAVFVDHWLTSW